MGIAGQVSERRKLVRMGVKATAQITGHDIGGERTARVISLSGSGMAIECDGHFELGNRFTVRLAAEKPVPTTLVANVEVVRIEDDDEGVQTYGLKIHEFAG